MKLGIIRCTQTEEFCPGTNDFLCVRKHKGSLSEVPSTEEIELVGFINCGGCPGKKAGIRAKTLMQRGADTIAFASCTLKGAPMGYPCPFGEKMKELVKTAVGEDVTVLEYTH